MGPMKSWKRIQDRSRILNLGAGNRIIKGAVNLDWIKNRPEIDTIWDLNQLPWPFPDERFLWIEAWAIFEHLDIGLIACLNESWRLLTPGGTLKFKVPWAGNPIACWTDPTHRRGYTRATIEFFDPSTAWGQKAARYTPYKWKIDFNALNPEKTSVMVRMRKRP